MTSSTPSLKPPKKRTLLWMCAPWLVWIILIIIQAFSTPQASAPPSQQGAVIATPDDSSEVRRGRTVLVIIDSLRAQTVDAHMPHLQALQRAHSARAVETCSANFTLVCVQTMLEGRQSPFVASLHNFTGTSGSPKSLPGAVARQGRSLRMISDYTLDSLYGSMAKESINVETWPGDHLTHDLRAISITREWLEQPDSDVILLHLIGTDKAAHRLTPEHPGYADHFERVDEALKPLIDALDPTRDHLVITGDHGHDEKGHHTQSSVLMVQSPLIEPLLDAAPTSQPIDQTELSYLLAVASGADLHLDYEGRYLGIDLHRAADTTLPEAERARLARFERTQVNAMREAGYDGETFEALARDKNRVRDARAWHVLARMLPLILLYYAWLICMLASWRRPEEIILTPARATVLLGGLSVALWLVGDALSPWLMAGASLALVVSLVYAFIATPLRKVWRMGATIGVIMALAAAISITGGEWRKFFHSVGEFIVQVPLFFVGMIVIALALSKLYSRSWTRAMPAMTTAVCLYALPGGVYYYQFGRNIVQSTFIGLGVWGIGVMWTHRATLREHARTLWAHPRALLALLASVVVIRLLVWQRGSSWIWQSGLKRWLTLERPELALPIFLALSAAFILSMRSMLWRAIAALNLMWIAGYSVVVGELGWPIASSVVVVALAISMSMRVEHDMRTIFAPKEHVVSALMDEQFGIWGAAAILMIGWTMLEGFFFENVAFNFTFQFVEHLKYESQVAVASSMLTYMKYAPLLWLGAVAMMERDRGQWAQMCRVLLWAMHIKMMMMLVQITFGAINATEKLHELTTSDLMFVGAILLHFLPGVWIMYKVERVARSRSRRQEVSE